MSVPDFATPGVCAHPLIQSQSPGGICAYPGCGKRKVGRPRKRTMLDAYALGARSATMTLEVPPPFDALPYNDRTNTRPKRWKAPKDATPSAAPVVLDVDGISALLRRCDAELMRRDFAAFVRAAWHVVNPGEEVIWGWHLQAICRHVQWAYEELFRVRRARRDGVPLHEIRPQDLQRLMINVPPRSAKSLIVAVFAPVWAWLHDPALTVRCTSGNLRVSDECSEFAFDLCTSSWFKETFEPEWQIRGDRTAKRKWANTAGGVRISMPMGAKVTGEGTDVVVIDDPQDAGDAHSEAKRESMFKRWRALSSRVKIQQQCLFVGIMQRLHEDDFTGRAAKTWVNLCIPMEFEKDRRCTTPMLDEETGKPWVDPRTEPGELMLPAFFTREGVEQRKIDLGSYGYAGQYQQRPAPEEGGLFKKAWFKPYDAYFLPDGKPDWSRMPKMDQFYVSIDAAAKEGDTNDFTSMQVIGRQGRFRYVLDNVTRRMDFVKLIEALRTLLARWPTVSGVLIEEASNGIAAVSMLQAAGIANVIALKTEGGKNSRAAAVSPSCEAGDVMIPAAAPWRDAWLHELAVFPNGAHDDQVDAFTQALNYMRGSVDLARLLGSCKW